MFANVAIPSEHDTPLSNCFERGEKNYDDVSASPRGYMNPSTQEGDGGTSSARELQPLIQGKNHGWNFRMKLCNQLCEHMIVLQYFAFISSSSLFFPLFLFFMINVFLCRAVYKEYNRFQSIKVFTYFLGMCLNVGL